MTLRTLGSLGRLEPGAGGAGGASGSKQCGWGRQPAALRVSACLCSFLPSLAQQVCVHEVAGAPSLCILGPGRAARMPSVHSPHSWSVSEQRQGLDQAWWGCRNVPG